MTVELRKVMAITEIAATHMTNVPYRVKLEETVGWPDKESALVLDDEAVNRLGFPVSLDIAGKKVLCVIESRESEEREQDDLLMVSLTSAEALKAEFGIVPPQWIPMQTRMLVLASSIGGDIHPTPTACPLYRFYISLDEQQYNSIKGLPVTTRFGFSLQMFE